MKTLLLTTVLAIAAFGANTAQGQLAHSYNHFDLGYERSSFQGMGNDILGNGNGIATDFYLSPKEHLLFAGEYHWSRPQDATGEGINTHDIKFGAGGYLPIGDLVSLYTHVGARYLRAETHLPDYTPSDWGLYVEPGIRANLTGNLEVYAAYEYTNILDTSLHAGRVGAILQFSEVLGLEAFGRFDDKWVHAYGGGLRISW